MGLYMLNLSLANEYIGDVIIPTQVIAYSQHFLQMYKPISLQYSNQIKLFVIVYWFCFSPSRICTYMNTYINNKL